MYHSAWGCAGDGNILHLAVVQRGAAHPAVTLHQIAVLGGNAPFVLASGHRGKRIARFNRADDAALRAQEGRAHLFDGLAIHTIRHGRAQHLDRFAANVAQEGIGGVDTEIAQAAAAGDGRVKHPGHVVVDIALGRAVDDTEMSMGAHTDAPGLLQSLQFAPERTVAVGKRYGDKRLLLAGNLHQGRHLIGRDADRFLDDEGQARLEQVSGNGRHVSMAAEGNNKVGTGLLQHDGVVFERGAGKRSSKPSSDAWLVVGHSDDLCAGQLHRAQVIGGVPVSNFDHSNTHSDCPRFLDCRWQRRKRPLPPGGV